MKNTYPDLTIVHIEKKEGYDYKPGDLRYRLPLWYHGVREKRLSELSYGDVARFIRQKISLDYLVPEALRRLWIDPTGGDLYNFPRQTVKRNFTVTLEMPTTRHPQSS